MYHIAEAADFEAGNDENGDIINEMPGMSWTNTFSDKGDTTMVTCQISFEKAEDLEKILEMGFKEGFTRGLQNLDEWLEQNKGQVFVY